jgi:all-trans-retinol dehydrogenase (NAD+)
MSQTGSRVIVLTGAASGLGRLLTERFLATGDRVAGLDIDDAALNRLSQSWGTSFHPYPVDVADPDAIERVFAALQQDLGRVDILINNAGVVAGKYFLEHTREDIERTFAINTLSHFHTARAVLPGMIAQGRGHIVTIASAGGLAATSRLSAYSSSKFAAIGFDDALRIELKKLGHPIDTTLVAPFYVNTGMFEGVKTRFPWLLPILDPEYVADRIHRAIEKRQRRLIMPRFVYLVYPLRLLPVGIYDWLADFFGVTRTMDDFRGRG